MITGLAALAAGEAAVAETAAETAVAAAELEGMEELLAILEDAAVPVPEVFSEFEAVSYHPGKYTLGQTLTAGAKGELALEALEAAELADEAELVEELSEYEKLNEAVPEQLTPKAGRSAVPLVRGSFTSQVSRLSEKAAEALQDAALRRNAEAALAETVAEEEALLRSAELLEDISHLSDAAGDCLGIASYPEFMLRHSPGSQ